MMTDREKEEKGYRKVFFSEIGHYGQYAWFFGVKLDHDVGDFYRGEGLQKIVTAMEGCKRYDEENFRFLNALYRGDIDEDGALSDEYLKSLESTKNNSSRDGFVRKTSQPTQGRASRQPMPGDKSNGDRKSSSGPQKMEEKGGKEEDEKHRGSRPGRRRPRSFSASPSSRGGFGRGGR